MELEKIKIVCESCSESLRKLIETLTEEKSFEKV